MDCGCALSAAAYVGREKRMKVNWEAGGKTAVTESVEGKKFIPLKELELTDHFLFSEVMSDPQVCRIALEIILDRKISSVKSYRREHSIEIHPMYKGVRLDVCFEDEEAVIYSVEIQNANRYNIPRRSRHYQSMIDVKIMPKGEVDYSKLTDGMVIFICRFDLFGLGRYRYTFENRCLEELSLSLGDGTRKIFLNTKGRNDEETNQDLVDFLHCIEYTNTIHTKNEKIKQILRRVDVVKNDTEVEGRYMTTQQWLNEIKADAIAEGRKEGLEQGIEEGIEEGIEQEAKRYSAMTVTLLAQKRYGDLEQAARDDTFRKKMYMELGIV